MSFLRRALGGDGAPEWASFMSGREYREFMTTLERVVGSLGWRATIGEGSISVDRGEAGPAEYGLTNLAQLCRTLDRADSQRAIEAHFAGLHAAEGAQDAVDELETALPLLKVRVYRSSDLPPEALEGMATMFLTPDLVGVLVADLPTTVQTLGRETVAGWGRPIEELLDLATDQTVAEAAGLQRDSVDLGDGVTATFLSGDSFFVASQVLRFDELAGSPPNGALVVLPARHLLIWYPIRTTATVRAVQRLLAVANRLYQEGPGPVSPELFWWHGALTLLPSRVSGGSVDFFPPDDFVELLNSLPGA